MSNWKSPNERPENKRAVWIIEYHPKKIYPQSYEIHAGNVSYSHEDPADWLVMQADEAGCGSCFWKPEEDILAWCYAEEFTEVSDVLAKLAPDDERTLDTKPKSWGLTQRAFEADTQLDGTLLEAAEALMNVALAQAAADWKIPLRVTFRWTEKLRAVVVAVDRDAPQGIIDSFLKDLTEVASDTPPDIMTAFPGTLIPDKKL